jgi:glycosyltransferase involved in cell wall biosynthesis
MKLLFVLPEYQREQAGGIRTFYCNLLPALAGAGCKVKALVACRGTFDSPSFTDEHGVEVEYLRSELFEKHSRSMAGSAFAGWPTLGHYVPVGLAAYEQVAGGEGFDAVELTDWPLYFLPWVALGGNAPITISLHSSIGQMRFHEPLAGWETETHFIRMLEASAFAAAPSVHTNSNFNARYWKPITGRNVDVLLPLMRHDAENASGCQDLGAGETEQQTAGAAIAGSKDDASDASCRNGAVFARLQTWKGAEVLAEALRLAPEVAVNWYGRAIPDSDGKGSYADALRERFPDIWGTRFAHQGVIGREQVLEKMRDAAFVCVPSLWDVFNLTVIEAMQQGAVVICSTQAGAEMLIEHGQNGFLFDPARPESLAAIMQQCCRLTTAERATIAASARQTGFSKCDPDALVRDRLAYYRNVASQSLYRSTNPFLKAFIDELRSEGPLKTSAVSKALRRLRGAIRGNSVGAAR